MRTSDPSAPYTGMEDAHATVLNLDEKTGDEKASFFAVYDGHGGSYQPIVLSANRMAFSSDTRHRLIRPLHRRRSGQICGAGSPRKARLHSGIQGRQLSEGAQGCIPQDGRQLFRPACR